MTFLDQTANLLAKPFFVLFNFLAFVLATPLVVTVLLTRGHLPKPSMLQLVQAAQAVPLGSNFVSGVVALTSSYTGNLGFKLKGLSKNENGAISCEAQWTPRPWHRNPFGSAHAAALVNFAEMSSGLVMMSAFEESAVKLRGIPKEITAAYLAKARGTLTASCTSPPLPKENGDVVVQVDVSNAKQETVCKVQVTWAISQKLAKKNS